MAGEEIFFSLRDTPSLALSFKNQINVNPINKQASILSLSLETPIRRLGEDYINKLMDVYLDRELKEKNRSSESTIRFIEEQLSGITDSLTFFENRLQNYRSENRIFNLSQEGTQVFQSLQELEKEKSQSEISLKYYNILLNYLKND